MRKSLAKPRTNNRIRRVLQIAPFVGYLDGDRYLTDLWVTFSSVVKAWKQSVLAANANAIINRCQDTSDLDITN